MNQRIDMRKAFKIWHKEVKYIKREGSLYLRI